MCEAAIGQVEGDGVCEGAIGQVEGDGVCEGAIGQERVRVCVKVPLDRRG